jgi:hypothetical protein
LTAATSFGYDPNMAERIAQLREAERANQTQP